MAADDLGIIDGFLAAFSGYIDGGFGLLSGDVAFLSTILIGIDVTLAGLFWAFGDGGDSVLTRLVRKVLYVGFFAWLLNDFGNLSGIIYESFAGLGLKASGSTLDPADLLRPGAIAATGYSAAHPLLEQASDLVGFPEIFSNALSVFVLPSSPSGSSKAAGRSTHPVIWKLGMFVRPPFRPICVDVAPTYWTRGTLPGFCAAACS